MNIDMILGKTHQEHSTHLVSVMNSDPIQMQSLRFTLTRAVSEKPSHIQIGMGKYQWGSCMHCGSPKYHHLDSLTNLLYWHLQSSPKLVLSRDWKPQLVL